MVDTLLECLLYGFICLGKHTSVLSLEWHMVITLQVCFAIGLSYHEMHAFLLVLS